MTQLITIEDIKKFVDLQTALFHAFIKKYPSTSFGNSFMVPEKDGVIFLDGDEWKFHRHGVGVEFTRLKDGVIIDNDREFHKPEFFNDWRLKLYMDSVKNCEHDLNKIKDCLKKFHNDGFVEIVTEYFYKLSSVINFKRMLYFVKKLRLNP